MLSSFIRARCATTHWRVHVRDDRDAVTRLEEDLQRLSSPYRHFVAACFGVRRRCACVRNSVSLVRNNRKGDGETSSASILHRDNYDLFPRPFFIPEGISTFARPRHQLPPGPWVPLPWPLVDHQKEEVVGSNVAVKVGSSLRRDHSGIVVFKLREYLTIFVPLMKFGNQEIGKPPYCRKVKPSHSALQCR